jgi:hypothetical protein
MRNLWSTRAPSRGGVTAFLFKPRRVAGDFACIEVKSKLDRVSLAKITSIAGSLLITLSMLPMLQGALITPLLAVIRESASDGHDSTFGVVAAACMLVALAASSASTSPPS